jgi:hypothetical protein
MRHTWRHSEEQTWYMTNGTMRNIQRKTYGDNIGPNSHVYMITLPVVLGTRSFSYVFDYVWLLSKRMCLHSFINGRNRTTKINVVFYLSSILNWWISMQANPLFQLFFFIMHSLSRNWDIELCIRQIRFRVRDNGDWQRFLSVNLRWVDLTCLFNCLR